MIVLSLKQWHKFFSYRKFFIITISCPLCLRELSGSSNPTKSLPHTWMQKCFIMKENSKVDILMSTVTKCNLSRLPEGFYTWKENIFMAAKKSLLKFAIVFASSSFVPRIKERLIFLTASDDFKSMMQTIKDSRLLSTTQQINPESLVHLSHSRTNKSPNFSKKENVIDLIS